MGSVVAVMRYVLKSARGESLPAVEVDPGGLRWDRAWACVDAADGTLGSAKHPRRWGALLQVTATVSRQSECVLQVAGRRVVAGTAEAEAVLGEHLGRTVRLTDAVPEKARLHRQLPEQPGLVPDWMSAAAAGQELVTGVPGARPGGRFADYAAVHVLTTGALADLARRLGRPGVDPARFRPNLVLHAPHDPEPGQELRIGDVVLRTVLPTPRCVVPGLPYAEDDPLDRTLLSVLADQYRTAVADNGKAACFGVYAEVVQPGRIRVGDRVG